MKVSVEVRKIIKCTIYSTVSVFTSGGGVDDVLVRLSLMKQIICQFVVHFIQRQTTTDISGIANEFVQYVQNYFQYVYIPI